MKMVENKRALRARRVTSALVALTLTASLSASPGPAPTASPTRPSSSSRSPPSSIKREFRDALQHFLQSNRLVPNKNVVFNIARTFEQLKRFADAHRYYIDALAVETDPKIIGDINTAIQRVAPMSR